MDGFAVVPHTKILLAKPLPKHDSAQAAELVALTIARKLAKNRLATIYTNSPYAFSTIHVFAKRWKKRAMMTSTGKNIIHKNLILSLLEVIQLPEKVAVCKCAARTKKDDPISQGNAKADAAAKEATTTEIMSLDKTPTYVDQEILEDMQNVSPQAEKQKWLNKGAKQENGVYM